MMLNLHAVLKATSLTPEPYLVSVHQIFPIRMLEETVSVVTIQESGSKTISTVLFVIREEFQTNRLEHVSAHQIFPMLMVMESASLVMPLHFTTPTATPA